jgi:uncharacterized protein YbaP (TraB family)
MQKMTDHLVDTYLKGDLDGLQDIIDDYMSGDYAALNEELIISRNKAWIPEIEELVKSQPTFIAVGAGHLAGKEGVIQLLRSSGFQVKPFSR